MAHPTRPKAKVEDAEVVLRQVALAIPAKAGRAVQAYSCRKSRLEIASDFVLPDGEAIRKKNKTTCRPPSPLMSLNRAIYRCKPNVIYVPTIISAAGRALAGPFLTADAAATLATPTRKRLIRPTKGPSLNRPFNGDTTRILSATHAQTLRTRRLARRLHRLDLVPLTGRGVVIETPSATPAVPTVVIREIARGLGRTTSVTPRPLRQRRTQVEHHEGRDITCEGSATALAEEAGENHVGEATPRAIPENMAFGRAPQGGTPRLRPLILRTEPIEGLVQHQETMGIPRRVGEAIGGLAGPCSHLRQGLPKPKRPIHPTDVSTLPSRQGDVPMPSQRHLVVIQVAVLRTGVIAVRDTRQVQAHVLVPGARPPAPATLVAVRTSAGLTTDPTRFNRRVFRPLSRSGSKGEKQNPHSFPPFTLSYQSAFNPLKFPDKGTPIQCLGIHCNSF